MSPAIPILIHLRDWPKPARPYNNLIALIALRDAGEKGLRAGQLSRLMGRNVSTDASTYLANLEKAGLVCRHAARHHRSTCYWTLSATGQAHVARLFTLPDACMVPV